MGRSWEERVREYVDSDRMVHRLHADGTLSCTILGNYGVYHVEVREASEDGWLEGRCTCPYDRGPCKHMDALRRTHERRPGSFTDLADVLDGLADLSRDQILDRVAEMIRRAPETAAALGDSPEPTLRDLLVAWPEPWR